MVLADKRWHDALHHVLRRCDQRSTPQFQCGSVFHSAVGIPENLGGNDDGSDHVTHAGERWRRVGQRSDVGCRSHPAFLWHARASGSDQHSAADEYQFLNDDHRRCEAQETRDGSRGLRIVFRRLRRRAASAQERT